MGAVLALWLAAQPGAAAPCRLALILAMDISASVDAGEDRLQRRGLARALASPEVEAAILSSAAPVALAVFEWSGRVQQDLVLPWTLLDGPEAIGAASRRIADSRRSYAEFATGMGPMLRHADALFAEGPDCDARTLDVSGDGVHNDGPDPATVYAAGGLAGVTVNGLAIVIETGQVWDHGRDEGAPQGLDTWFRENLIRGPGAFVLRADGFEDFERAMREKLVRETAIRLGGIPALPPHRAALRSQMLRQWIQ